MELAKSRGIDLVAIDSTNPLSNQGPFDAILHKLHGKKWNEQLKEFCEKYPYVIVIDPPAAIEKVHNRISMLQGIEKLKIMEGNETVAVPMQIVMEKPDELTSPEVLEELKFPVIAKPLVADGSATSHSMSLVFNSKGLKSLKPPLVLQEFVNHSGVIFKVYVVGDFVECVKRKSLRDVSHEEMQSSVEGLVLFSQISNTASENCDEGMEIEQAELPRARFIEELARGLRDELGLSLFNFDLIRDNKAENQYFVIDINYFPGYAKMPGFEAALTNFFLNVFHEKDRTSGKENALRGREIEGNVSLGEWTKDIVNDDKQKVFLIEDTVKESSVGDGVSILATDVE